MTNSPHTGSTADSELDKLLLCFENYLRSEYQPTMATGYFMSKENTKQALQAHINKRLVEALRKLPDNIKGLTISGGGVKTIWHEMDTISIQDLRLLIAELTKEGTIDNESN